VWSSLGRQNGTCPPASRSVLWPLTADSDTGGADQAKQPCCALSPSLQPCPFQLKWLP
jgi:hypothetical protein